jgi:hypothetical protein
MKSGHNVKQPKLNKGGISELLTGMGRFEGHARLLMPYLYKDMLDT